MPPKKRTKKTVIVPDDETKEILAEFDKLPEPQEVCGHRNLHYTEGVLTCSLPKDHEGNHRGEATELGEWSDAAGIPPRKHA